jgi:hypothetical protein
MIDYLKMHKLRDRPEFLIQDYCKENSNNCLNLKGLNYSRLTLGRRKKKKIKAYRDLIWSVDGVHGCCR